LDEDTLGVVEWEGLREAVMEDDPVKAVVMELEKVPAVVGELDSDPPPSKPLEDIKREGVWELVGEDVGEWTLEREAEGHWDPLSVTLLLGLMLGLLLREGVGQGQGDTEPDVLVEIEGEPVGGTLLALPPMDPDSVPDTDLVLVTVTVRVAVMQVLPLRVIEGLRVKDAQEVEVTEPLRDMDTLGLPLPLMEPPGEGERLGVGL